MLVLQVVTIFGIPYTEDYYHKWGGILTIVFSALPWCPFAKAMQDLGNATGPDVDPKGISWARRNSYCEVRFAKRICRTGVASRLPIYPFRYVVLGAC